MKKYILSAILVLLSVLSYDAFATVFTVTNNLDNNTTTGANQGDLRWCMNQANGSAGPHTINFAITGAAPYVITIASPLPTLNAQSVVINATTQTGWTLNPLVVIRGSVSTINQAFQITGSTQTIKGFIFQNLQQGININGGTGHNIQNCWFGIDNTGTTRVGNTIIYQGIAIGIGTNATSGGGTAATNVVIGGPAAADQNVLSGCLSLNTADNTKRGAIQLGAGCFGTLITGNILGLDPTGTSNTNLGNGFFPYLHHNIYMLGNNTVSANRVRITNNVISNCIGNGIWLEGGYSGTVITGNKIGTNLAGTTPMGNQAGGIRIDGAGGVPNVASDAHFIGVDETLNVGVGNSNRNIISGNGGAPDVRNCRANAFNGAVGCGAQYLPGCAPTSNCPDKYDGTLQCGIYLLGSLNTNIANNFIGTDVTGNATITATTISPYNGLGNLYAGIKIEGNSTGNTIGGTSATYANVIGGNGFDPFVTAGTTTSYLGHGIQLNNHTVVNTTVSYNFVGVGINGTAKVGNRQDGISLLGAKNSTITNNTVGFNTWGIFLQSDFGGTGQANQTSGNNISNNYVGTNSGLSANLANGMRTIAAGDPVTDTDGGGIGMQHGSYSNTVTNNNVKFNRDGIVLRNSGNGGPPYLNTMTGNSVVSNANAGIKLTQGSGANSLVGAPGSANIVGGAGGGLGNTITNNGTYGIELDSSQYNKIMGNTISSNTLDGINIHNGSKNNIIGGSTAEGNTISTNGGNGIQIKDPNATNSNLNAINRNSISCNSLRGIELNSLGNNNFAKPVFSGSPTSFTLTGPVGSWIELYALDGCNDCSTPSNPKLQGKTLVVEGNSPLSYTPSGAYAGLKNTDFTATASSAAPSTTNGATTSHNTSEFTACISLCVTPTTAAAGPDQNICAATTATLAGNTPSSGTGSWSVVSGTATITTPSSPTSGVTGLAANGSATLRWSISGGASGCTTSTDDVIINTYTTPSTANAGPDQSICAATTATLAATAPTSGTGAWSVVAGTATITNAALNNSGVTALAANGTVTLRWTVSNGSCTASTDDVIIKTFTTPSTAAAGPDQSICAATTATLAATAPTSGTGAWSVVAGTATITNAALNNSGVTALAANGTVTLRWTVSNGSCTASTDDVIIKTYTTPSTAAAGPDQSICAATTATLAATAPTSGTGAWSVVAGTATITNAALNNSGVTALAANGAVTLRWTVSNGSCTASTDDVIINTYTTPSTANAGPDQSICAATTATLAATAPTSGTGAWSVVAGTATIGNASQNNSGVSALAANGAVTLRWTVSNGSCTASTDDVIIKTYTTPSTAAAGPDQSICAATTATLAATAPTSGTGAWSVVAGTATITNAALNNSGVTALAANGAVTLRWTVSNGSCTASTDDVIINTYTTPSTANAGPDQSLCAGNTTLAGSTPTSGTGLWTVVSGTASITTPSSPNSAVTGLVVGTATLRWTISNGSCTASTDDIVITRQAVAAPTVTIAANSTNICTGTTVNFSIASINNEGSSPTYQWKLNNNNVGTNSTTYSNSTLNNGDQVTLVITSSLACANPTTATSNAVAMTVAPQPTTANANVDQHICTSTATLAANTPTAGTGLWTVVSGTATITTPTSPTSGVTGIAVGSATLRWTVSSSPCTASSDDVIISNGSLNTPNISSGGPTTFCEGGSVTLTANSNDPGTYTFHWKLNGTEIATGTSISATASGNYTVYIASPSPANCVSSETSPITVTINTRPVTPSITGNNSVCAQTSGLVYSVTNTPGDSYNWTVPGSATIVSGQGTNSITVNFPADATSGNISVTETNTTTSCSDLTPSTFAVTINQRPTQKPITGSNQVCAQTSGLTYSVPFTAGSSYAWTVPGTATITNGGGTNSITVNFPATATTGQITVIETNAASCSNINPDTFTVNINQRPGQKLITGSNEVCAQTSGLTYSVPFTGGSTYVWTVPGTATITSGANTNSITVNFPATATTGQITVIETNTASCSNINPDTFTVNINQRPGGKSITGLNAMCAPTLGVAYSVPNTNGSTYQWTVPGTASIASGNGTNAITVDFPASATSGAITVTETITATGCADLTPSSFNVTINPQPTTPIVKAQDTTVICQGGSVHLKIVSDLTGVTSIQWSDANGILPNETSSTLTTSTAGTYTVTINTTGTCSATSAGSAVIVNTLPVVSASPVGSGSCAGQPVQLLSQASGGSGTYLFTWTSVQDPTWIRTSQNPSFIAPDSTTDYVVTVQDASTNSPSCSVTKTVTLNVASPAIHISPVDSLCKGTMLAIKGSATHNTPGITYLWQTVGNSPIGYLSDTTILTPIVTVPLNETRALLQYKLTIVDNGCTLYRDILLDVNSIPTVAVSTNDTVVCGGSSAALHALVTGSTMPKYAYLWLHVNAQSISGDDTLGKNLSASTANDFSATVTTNPESNYFHLTLIDGHGCVGYSDTVVVNAFDKQNLMVPNLITPNGDHRNECFIIKDMNNFDILPGSSLEVYNRWGEAVYRAKNYSNNQPWCGGSLTDGIYYYHIKTGCGEQVIKGWIEILSNEAKF